MFLVRATIMMMITPIIVPTAVMTVMTVIAMLMVTAMAAMAILVMGSRLPAAAAAR